MNTNNKGISVIALVASVTIIILLLTTATLSGFNTSNNAKKISFGTEIYMIQTAVNSYYTKNGEYPTNDNIIIKFDSDIPKDFTDNNEKFNSSNEIIMYKIDYDLIDISSLKYGKQQNGIEDVYVVSKETGIVYYAMGYKIGNERYYTLTDEIKNILNYNNQKNIIQSNAIVFQPSTTNWTQSIKVDVKIPINYNVNYVKAGNDTITSSGTDKDNNYNIYNTQGSSNYDIIVNYIEPSNGETKTSKYSVTNVDNTPPTITLDSKKIKIEKDDSIGYIKVASKSDDKSGIKK